MSHLRRLGKHGLWLSGSLLIFYLVHRVLPEAALRGVTEVGGSFLQTFGGMYGVIVAFAIYVTWGQHNDAQIAVEKEAVSLIELYRILGWFPSWPQRAQVRERLHAYALAVPSKRPSSKTEHRHAHDHDHELLDQCFAQFLKHAPGSPAEERLHTTALDLFHELNEAREHRITVANLRLPEGLKWFVFLGGAMTVFALDLMWVDSATMQGALVAGLTWVVVAAASIMVDLDDPYTGDFVVDWHRFHQTAKLMEETHCTAA